MGASIWLQTKTLVKRNVKIKLRVKQASIQEVVMPIYFIVLLALLKTFAYKPTAYGPLSSQNITTSDISFDVSKEFFLAPNLTDVPPLIKKLEVLMPKSTFKIYEDQTAMEEAYKDLPTSFDNITGILFQNSISQYALRFRYGRISGAETDFNQGNCRTEFGPCLAKNFYTTGFASVQTAIDTALGQMNNSNFSLNIFGRIMPKEGTVANTDAFMIVGPLYLVMALGPYLTFLLVFIVYEKEKKIKEGMKMMGLNNLAYWFSWSIVYSVSLLVMTLVMTLIGYFGGLWGNSNFFLIFLLIFIYGQSIQMMAYMLTPFFNKAKTAGAVGGFLTIILSLIFIAIELTDFPESAVWAVSLLSPTAFAFVMGKVFYFEVAGEGAHFYNLAVGSSPMYIGLVMMLVDIVLYFLLTLYLDAVVPTEYGQRQSPFFCLRPSFWSTGRRRIQRSRSVRAANYKPQNFEAVPQEHIGNEAISFQGIRKVFQKKSLFGSSTETVAVKNFTLDIYEGQITALLGHNGAGKTTLFNILTGFVPATSGTATVYGYNVNDPDDMTEIRKITGVCPQHDILIEYLSVIEHLEVFAGLKGLQGERAKDEAERVMKVVDLEDQKNTYAKKLSGGQKRKLSVGIAIIGDPKILILDEPTAGMDPYSRRKLWNLLRSNQRDRVTLLTTHFMDEADILADRKAILAKGSLRCVGSSLFLKNRFGVGYHLGIVSKSHGDEIAITECVGNHIENAELQRSIGMEHVYTLPIDQVSKFPDLFVALDNEQENLGVQSYGVSMTTLEEVFLKIGEDDDEEEENRNGQSVQKVAYVASGKDGAVGHTNPDLGIEDDATLVNMRNSVPEFDPSKSEMGSGSNDFRILLQLIRRTLLLHLRNPGFVVFGILLPIVLEIVGTYLYTQAGSTKDGNDPTLYDLTYQNNLGSYSNRVGNVMPVLYNGLTGTANTSFASNVLSGVPLQYNALDDTTLFSFWPHAVGLDMSVFNSTQATFVAMYNTSYVRSLPSAINVVSNALLRYVNGDSSPNIVVYSKSWPQDAANLGNTFDGNAFAAALLISMAIVLPTALAASNPVKERETKVKTQLRVSGVRFHTYWLAYLIGDYLIFFVMAVVYIICIFAFRVTGLNNGGAAGALILMLIGWGAACLLTSYTASFLFDRFDTVQSSWPALTQLMCILPYICVSTLDLTGNREAAMYCNILFLILSPYYVGFSGVYYCFRIYINYLILGQANNIPASAYFDWSEEPMLPLSILMAYVHVVVFTVLLLVADVMKNGGEMPCKIMSSQVTSSECRIDETNQDVDVNEDDDVSKERQKIRQIVDDPVTDDSPVVVMDGMRKEFTKRTGKSCQSCRKSSPDENEEPVKVAVKNLSMTVYPGEVMGLLGPNGAGKTTALNVLIADIGATRGKVHIGGERITSSLSDAYMALGYCPQTNPLWDSITLQEHLEIYCAVRGVPVEKTNDVIFNFMEALDIVEHKDKKAKQLSGGTKRKLCFAISMLGNPKVVLLDEPSTGMDPKTKRFLWNTISTAFEGTNRGAILTTHYMDEADALCSRVGIMVLGQLRCLGSTQHLKGKFGQGYILEIKLPSQQDEQESDEESGEHIDSPESPLEVFIKELFPRAEQPEKFGSRWTYKIDREDITSLSKIFIKLEEAKVQFGIEEYSFSQSTLEQVFLRFAKEQAENDEEEQQRQEELKRLRKNKKK